MNQTYFNYQAPLRSIDLSRAMAIPKGVGPFVGFGSGKIESSSSATGSSNSETKYYITLYPDYYSGDEANSPKQGIYRENWSFLLPLIRDIKSKHQIDLNEIQDINTSTISTPVKFGVVTRDGFISVDTADSKKIPISNWNGRTGTPKEVVVLARHRYVPEAVDNPITLEAYALEYGTTTQSSGSTDSSQYSDINSFYDLYRRSMDIYYNKTDSPDFNKYNPLSQQSGLNLSYYDLLQYLKAKLSVYSDDDQNQYTLVGIYGMGSYTDSSGITLNEKFSIVPYEGKWPYPVSFNTAVMNSIGRSLSQISDIQEGFPYSVPGSTESDLINMGIKSYIDYQIEQLKSLFSSQITEASSTKMIPSGLICLWADTEIPSGWREYTAASGRVVIGYSNNGIPADTDGSTVLTKVGDTYGSPNSNGDWVIELTTENIPAHYHAMAVGAMSVKDDASDLDNPCPADWSKVKSSGTWLGNDTEDWDGVGMVNGKIRTGPNLTDIGAVNNVTNANMQYGVSTKFMKLFPAITLRYIQKE